MDITDKFNREVSSFYTTKTLHNSLGINYENRKEFRGDFFLDVISTSKKNSTIVEEYLLFLG
jgi:hypothetical protein